MASQEFVQLHERLKSMPDPVDFLVALFTYSPVGFAIWKPDGHLLLTNPAFRQLFGSEPPPEYNIMEDDIAARTGLTDLIRRAFVGHTAQIPTMWYDPRDLQSVHVTEGNRVAISMTIFPLMGEDGAVDFVAATYKDETEAMLAQERLQAETDHLQSLVQQMLEDAAERKRAEEAVKASEYRFQALIENSADMLTMFDANGDLIYASPSVEKIAGFTVAEVRDRPPDVFTHPDDIPAVRQIFASAAATPGVPIPIQVRQRKKNGDWIWEEGTITNWLHDPAVGAMVANFRDVTERHRAQEEILQLNAELENRVRDRTAALEAANKELESFAYSVSHDLRAPLRSIQGFSQIVLDDFSADLDPMAQNFLKRVRDASQWMNQLIDDLLKLSRLTRAPMSRTPVDLTEVATQAAERLRAAQTDREVEFAIAPELRANADPNLVRILLDNLIDNAWKYTSKHPRARIEVGSVEDGGQTAFFVKDDGAGFDMAYADKLFGVFQRLHSPAEFDGNGIGLATVQRIINRHGGKVWADAAVEQGATFYFTLS